MYSSLLRKLPFIIAGILLFVAVVRIYFRAKHITRSEFFAIFKHARYVQAWGVVIVFVLTTVFGVFNHLHAKQWVMAVVALNYSEASQAQNSNGTRYNMAEITCDEVVARAIEMGALENVTVKQLRNCLSVYPYIQGDVSDKSSYHISTEFAVEYCASKHTQHLDAENVIQLITSAYKEYYVEKYTDSFGLKNKTEKPDYSQMEYLDIVAYFNKETSSILNYLYGMADKAPSFVTENNTTFQSIAGKVFQFKETQINQNLRSLILQHGVVKDKGSYIDRLSYRNTITDFTRLKNLASFDLCNQAIGMYAEEMTRVVLVPTWDASGKYYMGRTKVGIDELSVMATGFSNDVATNERDIMDNNLVINKMQTASGAADADTQAESLITSIDQTIDSFTVEAIHAGREFSNYKMNQCIAVSISGSTLLSEMKLIAVFAVFSYLSVLLYAISKRFPKA